MFAFMFLKNNNKKGINSVENLFISPTKHTYTSHRNASKNQIFVETSGTLIENNTKKKNMENHFIRVQLF